MNSADKIYDLMSDKGFQEPRTGNLFFRITQEGPKPQERICGGPDENQLPCSCISGPGHQSACLFADKRQSVRRAILA